MKTWQIPYGQTQALIFFLGWGWVESYGELSGWGVRKNEELQLGPSGGCFVGWRMTEVRWNSFAARICRRCFETVLMLDEPSWRAARCFRKTGEVWSFAGDCIMGFVDQLVNLREIKHIKTNKVSNNTFKTSRLRFDILKKRMFCGS